MNGRSSRVAPTLVDAVRALASDGLRGFVFVKPDGTERLVSFQDIAREAERRGAHLAARGLVRGDRLAMVVPDGDEFVLSFLGALFAGLVPVPIYPQPTSRNVAAYHETLAHIARAAGATTLLTTVGTRPFVEPVLPRVDSLRSILTVEELAGDVGPLSVPGPAIGPDDLAFLQFTSGSTSRPKGVMVTHATLAANAAAFMLDGLHRDSSIDKGVSWLPLFHDMGLIGFVVGPLFTNVPCVFLPTASFVRAPRLWLDKIHEHRGTITYAPNFAYALVAKRLKDKEVLGLDLSCLRVAGCGAEPISARALRDFAAKLAPARFDPGAFVPSYGMAEATLAVTFVPLGEGLRTDVRGGVGAAPGTAAELVDCGCVFPQHELAIVDESGRRLADGQVGQIAIMGPSVTKGYFEDPDATSQAFRTLPEEPDGGRWLFSGDLGYLVRGRLFVCGRVKDIIIVRGRNYYPTDIEWAVGELPGVRRGAVVAFGVEVEGSEQLVVACEGAASDAAAIRDATAACIAERFGLRAHEVVVAPLASLPRTSSGKPQRGRTRQMYLDGTMPGARSVRVPAGGLPGEPPEEDLPEPQANA
jgi:fatty-acyl-CoA synthase